MRRDPPNDASPASTSDDPLVVRIVAEVVTYTVYFAWLSVFSAAALYLDVPPLPAIQDAIAVPWQGTAAAIASGSVILAVMRLVYDAIRARWGWRAESESESESAPPPEASEPKAATGPASERKRKKKKARASRKR